jgi:hypothetical protein
MFMLSSTTATTFSRFCFGGAQQLALLSGSICGLGAQQDAFFSTTFEVEPQQPEALTTEAEGSDFT